MDSQGRGEEESRGLRALGEGLMEVREDEYGEWTDIKFIEPNVEALPLDSPFR